MHVVNPPHTKHWQSFGIAESTGATWYMCKDGRDRCNMGQSKQVRSQLTPPHPDPILKVMHALNPPNTPDSDGPLYWLFKSGGF